MDSPVALPWKCIPPTEADSGVMLRLRAAPRLVSRIGVGASCLLHRAPRSPGGGTLTVVCRRKGSSMNAAVKEGGQSPRGGRDVTHQATGDAQMGRTRTTRATKLTKRGVKATRGRKEKSSLDMPDATILDVDLSAPLPEHEAAEGRSAIWIAKGIGEAMASKWPQFERRDPRLFRCIHALPVEPDAVDFTLMVEAYEMLKEATAIEVRCRAADAPRRMASRAHVGPAPVSSRGDQRSNENRND